MFTLKFFILFVLAGLCFGDTSDSETAGGSSGNEASSGTQKEEQDTETSNVGETSDGKENNAETSEGQNNDEGDIQKKNMGIHLPSFIGNDRDKVSYMNNLLSVCNTKHSLNKINKVNITFENCTFVCLSNSAIATNKEERIPTGLLCNSGGKTCPDEGPCPKLPLPSC
uniref:Putative ixodes 8-cys protein n=1 Tax=Ixodes ricinus TaxID=34613 RepID=A0A0K8RB45_IXORI